MKPRLLAFLVLSGSLFALSSTAQAQIPIIRGGAPVFRPAYLRANGPQPFSTKRSRELAAARSQGYTSRGTVFGGSSTRYQRSGTSFQSARRGTFFSRRSGLFR